MRFQPKHSKQEKYRKSISESTRMQTTETTSLSFAGRTLKISEPTQSQTLDLSRSVSLSVGKSTEKDKESGSKEKQATSPKDIVSSGVINEEEEYEKSLSLESKPLVSEPEALYSSSILITAKKQIVPILVVSEQDKGSKMMKKPKKKVLRSGKPGKKELNVLSLQSINVDPVQKSRDSVKNDKSAETNN